MFSRRDFLTAGAALVGGAPSPAAGGKVRIGVTDWNLRQASNVDAVALAAKLGFEGLEVSLGRKPVDNRLVLDSADLQAQYRAAAGKHKIRLAGTCLDILHVNYLKSDKLGQKWLADGISITKKLGAKVMLMPFFGKGGLETPAEMDYVGGILKELAPEAKKSGVVLGLENTLSAENNARIMDRAGSSAVSVFYDVGNSTGAGFDIIKEMRWLGASRICMIHLKDNPHYLGEGPIDFAKVFQVIRDIGYSGYADLETNAPSKSVEADMRRNLAFVRKFIR